MGLPRMSRRFEDKHCGGLFAKAFHEGFSGINQEIYFFHDEFRI